MNAREQLTGATYGSNLLATYGFDAHGYPNASSAGSVQDYRYVFDPVTGNLSSRQNYIRGLSESFSYTGNGDNLDRLTGVSGPQNLNMTYDANGNIKTKSDISSTVNFGYGTNAGPYALTEVSSSTGVIPTNPQAVTYTSFEKVATIAEGNYNAVMVYNSDNQRAKMDVTQSGSSILTRWYAGSSYMKETAGGVTREYTYLGGDAYTAPVAAVTQGGATAYYYLLRDYLGNITHQVNTSNEVVAEYNFDAWGRRRSADEWSYTLDGNDLALFADRGFTGHEHLTWFNLVNMNGRLYDPLVGRFLNVDPYVQMPDYTQNFNRYSYCLNNPLTYNDPSGEFIFTLLAAVIPGAQVFLPYAIAADISWMTDYGMQVGMNYANGYKGSDAWLKKIDWFDVGVSTVVGGITGGASAELKAGKELGKFATLMAKNAKLVTMGEMALTSAIDITGEGWQPVNFDDFGKRFAVNLVTFGATEAVSDLTKKLVKKQSSNGLPIQKHHFATNKNKVFTPQMESIAKNYGLDLDGEWNTELMEHLGRHPNAYHNFVLQGMQRASLEAGNDQTKFLQLFDKYVRRVVIDNPLLLRKSGW
jgi:RHS repeat-associated protein